VVVGMRLRPFSWHPSNECLNLLSWEGLTFRVGRRMPSGGVGQGGHHGVGQWLRVHQEGPGHLADPQPLRG